MRPAGYNTSKYTKQDPNDHFGAAFKCLGLIIGILVGIGAVPIGLAFLVNGTSDCDCFVLVMGIAFGVEGALLLCVLCGGLYMKAKHENNLVYDIETGETPVGDADDVAEETLGMQKRADGQGYEAREEEEPKKGTKKARKSNARKSNAQVDRPAVVDAPRKSRAAKDDLITQGPWAAKKTKSKVMDF